MKRFTKVSGKCTLRNSTAVDVHQHLWPAQFIDALRMRTHRPRLDGWTLHLVGEPPCEVDPAAHDPAARAALDPDLGRALVSLSSPLGIESLPPDEAAPLLDAWHKGALALPDGFGAWSSVSTAEPDLAGLKDLFGAGMVGLQLPATCLLTPGAVERVAAVLRVCELSDRPVLVHPGPVAARAPGEPPLPAWWPAVVDYSAQLQAAWWSWQAAGRALLPELRICFVAGAGLGPVHHERFAARGGDRTHVDPDTFVDTSSYGRTGIEALIRVLGIDPVVLGSDRPYAEPLWQGGSSAPDFGAAARHAVRVSNPRRLLHGGRP